MKTSQFKSGTYKQKFQYKSFVPSSINHEFKIEDQDIISLLEECNKLIGELNSFSDFFINLDFFVKMQINSEATSSTKIEGTKTEIEESVLSESQISSEKKDDWEEVQNYIKAQNYALARLEELPFSIRLLKETHKVLLSGVRGERKNPGDIRRSQNWIGGANLVSAFFIPPCGEDIGELLSDLEKFIHNENLKTSHLIKAAIIHYQFETIHPFLDGNGRLGRLMVLLYLIDKKVLNFPILALSGFFEQYRGEYFDSLTMVRKSNDLDQWLKFFLTGIKKSAEKSIFIFKGSISLKEKFESEINLKLGKRKEVGIKFLNLLFKKPVVDYKDLCENFSITHVSANSLIKAFLELGILHERTGFKRNKIFEFRVYLDLFKRDFG